VWIQIAKRGMTFPLPWAVGLGTLQVLRGKIFPWYPLVFYVPSCLYVSSRSY